MRPNFAATVLGIAMFAALAAVHWALADYPIIRLPLTALLAALACGLLLQRFEAPLADRRFLRRTAYAITSERAIVLNDKRLLTQQVNQDTRFRRSGTTPETLEIWDATDQARAEVPPLRFQQLPDGRAAAVLESLITGVSLPNN